LLVAIPTPPLENIRSWLGYPAVGAITQRARDLVSANGWVRGLRSA
jgi:hypothetical protein